MIIDCVSDLHGHYTQLEGGDLLIIAGDFSITGEYNEYLSFIDWMRNQDYKTKIFIPGNHDNICLKRKQCKIVSDEIIYLCDYGTELEGLKIWGSPWTKRFEGMNQMCMAFTVDTEEELAEKWDMIPGDVDILVTHSPPFGTRDKTHKGYHVGSGTLSLAVMDRPSIQRS